MDLKPYLKPVDVEGMVIGSVGKFMLEVKAFLKAWGDPDDVQSGGNKKTYLDLLKHVQDAEADLLGFAGHVMSDNVCDNTRDILSIIYGIGSAEVHAYDVYARFDAKLDPAESGKGFAGDGRLVEWVGIGDGVTSGEIAPGKAGSKPSKAKKTE